MKWLVPPRVKVFEALGCIAEGRVELSGDTAKVFSSSRGKFYTVSWSSDEKAVMSNDNGSYWRDYLGYPAIAFLMLKRVLPFDERLAGALKGIPWKVINQRVKNDFAKTEVEVFKSASAKGVTREELVDFAERVLSEIEAKGFSLLGEKIKPPAGY